MSKQFNIKVSDEQLEVLSDFAKSQDMSLEETFAKMISYYTEHAIPYFRELDKQAVIEGSKVTEKILANAAAP